MRIAVLADVHGNRHAFDAVVERGALRWAAALRAVPYDHEAAARQAERAGRADAAHAARTGRMPPAGAGPA